MDALQFFGSLDQSWFTNHEPVIPALLYLQSWCGSKYVFGNIAIYPAIKTFSKLVVKV